MGERARESEKVSERVRERWGKTDFLLCLLNKLAGDDYKWRESKQNVKANRN